jgi:thiol-disulfide isomerase/thioredoxin
MTRSALAAVVGPLLVLVTACGGVSPGNEPVGRSHVDVASSDLTSFKRHTDIPDCPKVGGHQVDGGMPAITVPCLGGGRSVDLAGLRGPMIVNFWQSTCHPCRQEMPALAAYARHQSEVKVLGIDINDVQPGAALELAKQSKVGYPLVADPAGNLDGRAPLPRIPGLPFTVFLAASGKIVHVEAGAMTSEQDVAARAATYLGTRG